MSITTSLCNTTPFPNKTVSRQTTPQLPGAWRSHPSLKFTAKPSSSSKRSVLTAATSTAKAEPEMKSATAPKVLPFRIGHGFDLHWLEPGYPLIIEGINIPHDRGCEAHSDDDVLLHCVVDAILGALGLPDIGQIFPDTDPKWKGAASSVFMKEAVRT